MNNNNYFILLIFWLLFNQFTFSQTSTFTIAFGSCNDQNKTNPFWENIMEQSPNLWIWGGDTIYADTDNMEKMRLLYEQQKNNIEYSAFTQSIPILGTWDDHDYGVNDGGEEFEKKQESQQLFLDFLNVPANSPRRKREGIYHSKIFKTPDGTIKVILLDTRYFRSPLTKSKEKNKRYQPNKNGGTILGLQQWKWLNNELNTNVSDFTILVSSIQILSAEHGFEKWANFPTETDKLFSLIKKSKSKNIIFLSGDRHISEFSTLQLNSLKYPLIDFTSSGLTHSYESYTYEPNKLRKGNVVNSRSYGLIKFNFKERKVIFKMMGEDKHVLQEFTQFYP
ncbi:alkaline phosphatase D [Tenacibaculum sp. MAR_2009_124]|uniref:alkaline phosphatase D family protein n=1 Tax=Tenacibaculum sp. MAR_2009_124 TaxID=1250059 RepID=UPI000896D650|nr:alkaline phosphatase D family protein [Tenacibaculum sp. MAR_2009_124]SEB35379.1 alkaline phosphatase D [Tenacibaculum sp. MAR_2009_124]